MIAVFVVLAAIAMASGLRGERWSMFAVNVRSKVLAFALIYIALAAGAASTAHLSMAPITFLILFLFLILVIATVALAFYAMGRLVNATKLIWGNA